MHFQIEFAFRDARQHVGLNHYQSRKEKRLDFHFNASLTAVNIAKIQIIEENKGKATQGVSIDGFKRRCNNFEQILKLIKTFDVKPGVITRHPGYLEIIQYGNIVA